MGARHACLSANYGAVVDIRASMAGEAMAKLPAADVGTLAARYRNETSTDLLLLK